MTTMWRRLQPLLVLTALLSTTAAGTGSAVGMKKTVVKGRVTAVDTGAPIAKAKVAIDGVGKARTTKNGRFVIRSRIASAGTARVTIRARGYVVRETSIEVPTPGRRAKQNWNLLPKVSEEFDLDLLDAVARSSGVVRWEPPLVVRILLQRLECRELVSLDDAECTEWVVTSDPISARWLEWFRGAVEALKPLVAGPSGTYTVEEVQLRAGETIAREMLLRPGTFTVGEVAGRNLLRYPFPLLRANGVAAIESSLFLLPFEGSTLLDPSRRLLAAAFGYYRFNGSVEACDGLADRGRLSFFCPDHELVAPTSLDANMARAIYTRAIGNRPPDRDPESVP